MLSIGKKRLASRTMLSASWSLSGQFIHVLHAGEPTEMYTEEQHHLRAFTGFQISEIAYEFGVCIVITCDVRRLSCCAIHVQSKAEAFTSPGLCRFYVQSAPLRLKSSTKLCTSAFRYCEDGDANRGELTSAELCTLKFESMHMHVMCLSHCRCLSDNNLSAYMHALRWIWRGATATCCL